MTVKRLNVLYLIRTWALGGSHTIMLLLMKHLPKELFNITVVPYDTWTGTDQQFIKAAIKEGHAIPDDRIPWRSRTAWFAARNKVDELIKKYDIDLLHAHDTLSIVLTGIGRKRWPCACVASPYGWWQPKFNLRVHANHWAERNLALPNFDRVITVSNDMKQKILQGWTPEEKIRVINTGLDLNKFDAGAPREQVRREFHLPDDACVVGTVSRLFAEKGHSYLLDAAKLLANDLPQLRVMIVGTGDLRKPLEDYATELGIRDRVIFTGFYEDLPGALRAMDIFAQPSILEEGFPTSVLEAQVAGLPVVASDIGGTHETMDAGKTGLLVPPRDVNALAQALRTLVSDNEKRKTMGQAARAWIEKSFTLENMIQKVTQTYLEAIEVHRKPETPIF